MLNSTVRPRSLRSTALSSYTFLICLIRPHSPTSMLNAMVASGLALNFAQIDHPPTSTAPSFQSQDPASDHPTSPCGCECQCSSPTAFSEAAELKQAEAEHPNGPDRGVFEDAWQAMVCWLASSESKAADDLDGELRKFVMTSSGCC